MHLLTHPDELPINTQQSKRNLRQMLTVKRVELRMRQKDFHLTPVFQCISCIISVLELHNFNHIRNHFQ